MESGNKARGKREHTNEKILVPVHTASFITKIDPARQHGS
jgi:hypothetical protein